jgi:hypothetical protein
MTLVHGFSMLANRRAQSVRVTTAFERLVRLEGVNVTAVEFSAALVVVTMARSRHRLVCPEYGCKTSARYDAPARPSRWRHLDLGVWRVEVRGSLRRPRCPSHGVGLEDKIPWRKKLHIPGMHTH